MWKFSQTETPAASPNPEKTHTAPVQSTASHATPVSGQSSIGKGMVIVGEISGSEPLFIDGRVEGSIDLPNTRVTIGPTDNSLQTLLHVMCLCLARC